MKKPVAAETGEDSKVVRKVEEDAECEGASK